MEKVMSPKKILFWAMILTLCCPALSLAKYPDRPIQFIIPWAPGGASDLGARVITDRMAEFLGQPIINVFKPGGGGTLGSSFVAAAKPDGYTLLSGSDAVLVIQPILKKGLSYSIDSFDMVGGYAKAPSYFSIKPDASWKALGDFIADAKKNPKKYKCGIPGVLTTCHVAWEVLANKAGFQTVAIPYPGTGEVLPALLGGHIDVAVTAGVSGLSSTGSIRILGVAEKKRLTYLPTVPTTYDFGYPVDIQATYCFCAPKGTPKEIIKILYSAQEKAFKKYDNEIQERLGKIEQAPFFITGENFYKLMKEREAIYSEIGKTLGVIK